MACALIPSHVHSNTDRIVYLKVSECTLCHSMITNQAFPDSSALGLEIYPAALMNVSKYSHVWLMTSACFVRADECAHTHTHTRV